jgi:amidophosphoribosyltransferase
LRYLPVESLARSVGLAPDRLCRACVTAKYPTPTGQQLFEKNARETCHATGAGGVRAYE